jgi:hypothetical protein
MILRQILIDILTEVMREHGVKPPAAWTEDLPLLQTGLDSLGYAVVVTRLEQILGYDPFLLLEEPVYPRTFGEFLAIYERFKDRAKPGKED